MSNPQIIRYNCHYLTRYIGDVIAVTDGVPALVDGWQSVVDGLCTFKIPEAFQKLCDLLRDNEQACAGLIGTCKSVRIFEPWQGFSMKANFPLSSLAGGRRTHRDSFLASCFSVRHIRGGV